MRMKGKHPLSLPAAILAAAGADDLAHQGVTVLEGIAKIALQGFQSLVPFPVLRNSAAKDQGLGAGTDGGTDGADLQFPRSRFARLGLAHLHGVRRYMKDGLSSHDWGKWTGP